MSISGILRRFIRRKGGGKSLSDSSGASHLKKEVEERISERPPACMAGPEKTTLTPPHAASRNTPPLFPLHKTNGRPPTILFGYTNVDAVTAFLRETGFLLPSSPPVCASAADFLKIRSNGGTLFLFLLRGQKKYLPVWESLRRLAGGVIYLADSPQDKVEANIFEECFQSGSELPFGLVTRNPAVAGSGAFLLSDGDEVKKLFTVLMRGWTLTRSEQSGIPISDSCSLRGRRA